MISATFVTASTFSVTGNHVSGFAIGRRLLLTQGTVDIVSEVSASSYFANDDYTLVTIDFPILNENLSEVKLGPTYVDGNSHSSNISKHLHTSYWDGGAAAFSGFTDSGIVERLNIIGTEAELGHGFLYFTGDENIAVIANSASGDCVPLSNSANNGATSVKFYLSNLKDVILTNLTDGQGIVWSADQQKFVNGSVSGGSGGNGGGSGSASSSIEQELLYYLRF